MGGSGGGSSSGAVSYPAYMQSWHETWLDNVGTAMTAAQATSPFSAASAYDPTTYLGNMATNLASFAGIVAAFDATTSWEAAVDAAETKVDEIISDEYINADVAAFADTLDDQIVNKVIPAFESGMRDINAVMSSSFALGKSVIYGFRDRDVSSYSANLRTKLSFFRNEQIFSAATKILEAEIVDINLAKDLLHYTIETNRISIVAKKEQADQDLAIDESDAMWDLSTFQYGANMLGAIAGGTVAPQKKQISAAQSAIGGALSGAAAGAMIGAESGAAGGGAWGALIGAVVGGIGGIITS